MGGDQGQPSIAALLAEGYTHLQVSCGACYRTAFVPLDAFSGDIGRVTVDDVAPRFRCRSCGKRPPDDMYAMPWHPDRFSFRTPDDSPTRRWLKHGIPLIPRGITQEEWASYNEQERARILRVKRKGCGWL